MTERPLVTLAVIAYNQEHFIQETVEGAFAQTYEPLEIILSDDRSSDQTFEIMEKLAKAYNGPHNVIVSRNEQNLGLVPHIDRVMEIVSGEFIVINAGDDVSIPQRTIKLAQKWIESKGAVKLVHSSAAKIDERGKYKGTRTSPQAVLEDPTPHTIAVGCHFILGATAAWDKSVFEAFGPLGGGISAEDRIIPFRASILGEIAYVNENLIKHRSGGISTVKTNKGPIYEYLYGLSHAARKSHSEADLYTLERFRDVSYPRKAEVERTCRDRGPILSFAVALAEASHSRRWKMVSKSILLAWRHKNLAPLKDWVRYTFDSLYISYANLRLQVHNDPTVDKK